MAQLPNQFTSETQGIKNTGWRKQKQNKMGVKKMIVLTPVGAGFDTITDALSLTAWEVKFKAAKSLRWYAMRAFNTITDKSTDDVFSKDLTGNKLTALGDKSFQVMIDANPAECIALSSFNGKQMGAFVIDASQSIQGTTSDGVKVESVLVDVYVGTPKDAEMDGKVMIPVTFNYVDPTQIKDAQWVFEPSMNATASWNPLSSFDGVYDVNLSISGATVTGCKVNVNLANILATDPDSFVDGLVKADFILKTSAGVTKTITSALGDSLSGYYIVATLAANDTIDLVLCSAISLTSMKIESTGKATVTI